MELEALTESLALPLSAIPPLLATPLGSDLYVAGLDVSGQHTRLLALDERGRARGIANLPVAATAMTAAEGALVVAGGPVTGQAAGAVLAVGADGAIQWRAPLPVGVRPHLAGVAGQVVVAWESERGIAWTPLARLASGFDADSPAAVAFEDPTYSLAVAGVDDRLIALRLHGPQMRLELLAFADEQLAARAPVGDVPVKEAALAASNERARVAWLSAAGEIGWQSFDAALTPGPARQRLPTGGPPVGFGWIAAGERAALRLRRASGRPETGGGLGCLGVVPVAEEVVQLAEGTAVHPLRPPGTMLRAGSWIGDRLMVLHGADSTPFVSVYRLRP
jgi:hypothetical protein